MSRLSKFLPFLFFFLIKTSWALGKTLNTSSKPILRIMPLGASITQGFDPTQPPNKQYGYRLPLRNLLRHYGFTVDMVGSRTNGAFNDSQHEGYPGMEISEVADKALPSVRKYKPNLVLILLGTNDCLHARGQEDLAYAAGAGDRMKTLVHDVYDASPGATVLLATLPPLKDRQDAAEYFIAANQGYEELVKDLQSQGCKIEGVDMWNGKFAQNEYSDGIHMNRKGYARMAMLWGVALNKVLVNGWVGEPAKTEEGEE